MDPEGSLELWNGSAGVHPHFLFFLIHVVTAACLRDPQSYVKPLSIANEADRTVSGARHPRQPDGELSAFPAAIHTSVCL